MGVKRLGFMRGQRVLRKVFSQMADSGLLLVLWSPPGREEGSWNFVTTKLVGMSNVIGREGAYGVFGA